RAPHLHSFPTRRSSDLVAGNVNSNAGDLRIGSLTSFPPGIGPGSTVTVSAEINIPAAHTAPDSSGSSRQRRILLFAGTGAGGTRSEEHTSELQSRENLV